MYKTKLFLNLSISIIVMGLIMLPQAAFSYKEHGTPAHSAASVSQFEKIDTTVGTGEEVIVGKTVNVHYTGWMFDENAPDNKGEKFDSSRDRDNHFSFLLGSGSVIKGWDQGVLGMKIGGHRTLIIPPSMAYGAQGAGNIIPPNSTLIFDIELTGFQSGPNY